MISFAKQVLTFNEEAGSPATCSIDANNKCGIKQPKPTPALLTSPDDATEDSISTRGADSVDFQLV